jgi:protein-disulfide isomerase
VSTKTASRSERIRAEHRAEAARKAAQRRQRKVLGAVVAVLVVAAAVGIAVGTFANRSHGGADLTPPGVTAQGGIVVGSSTAPFHLVAYEDPQCPTCGRFEKGSGQVLAKAVDEGKVSVEYRMRSFLGVESVRAVNALAAAHAAGKFEQLRRAMYANQPEEKTGGYTTTDLLELGAGVGLTSRDYTSAVKDLSYGNWVRRIDDLSSRAGNVQTPEFIMNDHPIDSDVLLDPAAFARHLGLS